MPTTDLLHKDAPYVWTDAHDVSFNKIKDTIRSNLRLTYFSRGGRLRLYCDASGTAGGAVLFMETSPDSDIFKPIFFLSKKFSNHQRNLYSALELEISNVLYSLEKLRYLIEFEKVEVLTDAKAMLFLLRSSRVASSPRLNRLAAKLSSFPVKYTISYVKPNLPGLQLADCLSRQYEKGEAIKCPRKIIKDIEKKDIDHNLSGSYTMQELAKYVIANKDCVPIPKEYDIEQSIAQDLNSIADSVDFVNNVQEVIHPEFINHIDKVIKPIVTISQKLDKQNVILEQKLDKDFMDILHTLNKENLKMDESLSTNGYFLKNGLLFKLKDNSQPISSKNSLLAMPESLLPTLISNAHIMHGHLGATALYNLLKVDYFNKNLRTMTLKMIAGCHACQMTRPINYRKNPIFPLFRDRAPMDMIAMDHFKMNRKNGNDHILLIIDMFSKFVWLFPCKNEKAIYVIRHLENLFSVFGPPRTVKSDNAKSLLRNKKVQELLNNYGVKKSILSLPYHPMHNANAERAIRSIRELIKIYDIHNQDNWADLLPQLMYIHNTTPRPQKCDDKTIFLSPFAKFFLRPPPQKILSPENVLQDQQFERRQTDIQKLIDGINRHTMKMQQQYQEQHNKKAKQAPMQEGDLVLYKDNQPQKQGEAAKKIQIPFYNRLFLLKHIKGALAVIEDLVDGSVLKVYSGFLKRYDNRNEIFDNLDIDIQTQMGTSFEITNLDTRQQIIDNLQRAGFDTSRAARLDEDFLNIEIPPLKRKTTKNPRIMEQTKKIESDISSDSSVSDFQLPSKAASIKMVQNPLAKPSPNGVLQKLKSTTKNMMGSIKDRLRKGPRVNYKQ